MKRFGLTNSVVEGTEWISRLAMVNLIWLLFSIPVITFIPATDALFQVMNDWSNGELHKPIFRTFFYYFKQNFWSSFKLGLLFCVVAGILYVDIWFLTVYGRDNIGLQIYKYALYTFGVVIGLTALYSYPLSKKVILPKGRLYLSSLVLMISQPLVSLGLLTSIGVLTLVLLKWPALFFFFSVSILGWLSTLALNKGYEKNAKNQTELIEE